MAKQYSGIADERSAARTTVNEAKAEPYGRKERGQDIRTATSVATVKRRLKKPVKRTRRDIAWALDIVGIGAGPVDLSENARSYLYGHK